VCVIVVTQEAEESKICEMFVLIIMRDFSYPDINWNILEVNSIGDKFLKLFMDYYLGQHVSLPTRSNNVLDLILTNKLPIKNGIRFLAPVDNSDHNVLLFSIDCNKSQDKEKRQFSRSQADYTDMWEFVNSRLSHMDFSTKSSTL